MIGTGGGIGSGKGANYVPSFIGSGKGEKKSKELNTFLTLFIKKIG